MTKTLYEPRRHERAIIASRIFSPEPAAASFRLAAVKRALVAAGFDVTVLTTVPAPGGERGRAMRAADTTGPSAPGSGSVTVKRWGALRDKTGYVRGYLPYISFDIPLFFRLLCAKRPGVILVEPPPTTGAVTRVAAALKRVPYVWYAADVWSDATEATGAPSPVVDALRVVERFAIRGASGIIAVSDGVADRVADLGGTNIRVIPNGIDTDTYSPDVAALDEDQLRDLGIVGPYFVYAGTASEWQGAKVFAEAMRTVRAKDEQLQVVFVGQGTEWEDIGQVAAELRQEWGHDAIVQVPPQSPHWVARLLAGSEGALVSIVPEKGYDFAYPTKVLAALATGKPVIYAGKGPVVRDLAEGRLGISVDHNPFDVAEAITAVRPRTETEFAPGRLRNWVMENRSTRLMGDRAALFLEEIIKGRKRK